MTCRVTVLGGVSIFLVYRNTVVIFKCPTTFFVSCHWGQWRIQMAGDIRTLPPDILTVELFLVLFFMSWPPWNLVVLCSLMQLPVILDHQGHHTDEDHPVTWGLLNTAYLPRIQPKTECRAAHQNSYNIISIYRIAK